jgi:Uma2 family endonuclease
MPALASASTLISVEDYLAAEETSEVRHEYLSGLVYPMSESNGRHSTINANLAGLLHFRMPGSFFRGFSVQMKVRLQIADCTYFYYPDAMIVRERAGLGASWAEQPRVLFEIISESTRAIDEREKRMASLSIPTLDAYVLIEQELPRVVLERRTPEGWTREILGAPDAALRLPAVDVEFPVADLYERLDEA